MFYIHESADYDCLFFLFKNLLVDIVDGKLKRVPFFIWKIKLFLGYYTLNKPYDDGNFLVVT